MRRLSNSFPSPAIRRALFLTVVGSVLLPAAHLPAQTPVVKRPAPVYVAGDQADQTEGRRALEEFRAAGVAGSYWLELTLRVMPHKGAERNVHGQIFGQRNGQGLLTRLSLDDLDAPANWLIQSGPQPASWVSLKNQPAPRALTAAESLTPIGGTDLTPFDLQMPFLYWEDFIFEGVAKIRSRPAYSFLLYPPADLAAVRPDLGAVRVALDTQFHALVQAEVLDSKGGQIKSITVLDLKKIGEQWLPRSIDLRNRATKDKTRIEFTAAALNLTLADSIFVPESLGVPVALPEGTKPERF